MSDNQGVRSGSRPGRELQELMERVASLEVQLKANRTEGKGQEEEGKCVSWPGWEEMSLKEEEELICFGSFGSFLIYFLSVYRKYNSLIQAQARELSHLRQRMREGQGVCHILTQHLGDTTKVQQCVFIQLFLPLQPEPDSHAGSNSHHFPSRLLKSSCGPTMSITTWVRASESSWLRAAPWHKELSPR